jgi:hypothetical protein
MIIRLLFFGESINIPSTSIGFGIGAVSIWVNGFGFTSATNDLGALGYVLLETRDIDVGDPGEEITSLFTNLHGQVVDFEIKTNHFFKDGGIARVVLTRSVQEEGALVDKKIEFQATDCRGVSLTANPMKFSVEMMMLENTVFSLDEIVSEDDLVAIIDNAPTGEDQLA